MENEKQFISLDEVKEDALKFSNEKDKVTQFLQLVTFQLGGDEYAIPIDKVKEVVPTPKMAKVPHSQDFIRGVANIRGTITAVVDLNIKFGVEKADTIHLDEFLLVLEEDKYEVGILVNEVPDTIEVDVNDIDDSNEVLQFSGAKEQFITGIAKIEDRMILLVDIISMLSVEDVKGASNI